MPREGHLVGTQQRKWHSAPSPCGRSPHHREEDARTVFGAHWECMVDAVNATDLFVLVGFFPVSNLCGNSKHIDLTDS